MRKTIALLLVLALTASSVIFLPVKAESQTIVVPDDYHTIEEAINAAHDGDTIYVKAGTYDNPVNQSLLISKTVSLIGQDAESTTLHLHPEWITKMMISTPLSYYASPLIIEGNNIAISGLTITSDGGEIRAKGIKTEITNNIFYTDLALEGSNQIFTRNTLIGAAVTCRGTNATISHNTVLDGLLGSDSGTQDKIFGNNVVGSIGIGGTSTHEFIYNNNVRENGQYWAGISVASIGTIVTNNTVSHCSQGITIDWGSDNKIYGNTITNNNGPAFVTKASSNSEFYANHIENNQIGIQAEDLAPTTFYHNNLVNNTLQLKIDEQIFFWNMDNGKEGNYWSDYKGDDMNGDGLGDSNYQVRNEIIDRFPLMRQFDINSVGVIPQDEDEPKTTTPILTESQPESLGEFLPAIVVLCTLVIVASLSLVYFRSHRQSA